MIDRFFVPVPVPIPGARQLNPRSLEAVVASGHRRAFVSCDGQRLRAEASPGLGIAIIGVPFNTAKLVIQTGGTLDRESSGGPPRPSASWILLKKGTGLSLVGEEAEAKLREIKNDGDLLFD